MVSSAAGECYKDSETDTCSTLVVPGFYAVSHIFREDANTDSLRKSWMQNSLVLGLMIGYPLTEKITQHSYVYWSLAGSIFLLGSLINFTMNSRKLTIALIDQNLKISMGTILFKKVGGGVTQRTIACLWVLFFSNLIPSVIDFSFKHIIDEVDKEDKRLLLYFVPGASFFLMLIVRRLFFVALGSRIGIMMGSFCLSGSCYLFWPITRQEGDEIGYYLVMQLQDHAASPCAIRDRDRDGEHLLCQRHPGPDFSRLQDKHPLRAQLRPQ